MTRNVYDDPSFFDAYAQLPRSVHGLDGAPEWPDLRAMLPSVAGRRVLDLGCGYGWFSRWAAEQGASRVLGLDGSARMLERAEELAHDPIHDGIEYGKVDLDGGDLALGPASFDVAFSSLTLHYLVRLGRLLADLATALVPGGDLVFSAEHPLLTAPSRARFAELDGRRVWPVDRYLDEGPRVTEWLAPGVIKQHRTIGTYLRLLRRAGFDVVDLVEWGPTPDEVATHPDWAGERDRPMFFLCHAQRR